MVLFPFLFMVPLPSREINVAGGGKRGLYNIKRMDLTQDFDCIPLSATLPMSHLGTSGDFRKTLRQQ